MADARIDVLIAERDAEKQRADAAERARDEARRIANPLYVAELQAKLTAAEHAVVALRRVVELVADVVSASNTPESREWAAAWAEKTTKLSFDEWIVARVLTDTAPLAAAIRALGDAPEAET